MVWVLGDALGHTKKATSTGAKKQWAGTANAVLSKTGDEGKAVRIANSAVKKCVAAVKKRAVGVKKGRVARPKQTKRLIPKKNTKSME